VDKILLNAYTTPISTFAGPATSAFPISTSNASVAGDYFVSSAIRNKIRIDQVYGYESANTWHVRLKRFGNLYYY
jgi:hypothetical protein